MTTPRIRCPNATSEPCAHPHCRCHLSGQHTQTVEIDCEVRRETAMAWLIHNGAREVWIAKSQISAHSRDQGLFGSKVTSITIPTWLATEKGLV